MNHLENINYLISSYGYIAIFFVIFLAEMDISLPLPIPSEITLLFTGYGIFLHKLAFGYAIPICISADFLGALALFLICHKLTENKFVKIILSNFNRSNMANTFKKHLDKRTIITVILGRLIPYARNYITIGCGILRVSPKEFIPSIISSIIWTSGLISIGYKLGSKIYQVQSFLDSYGRFTAIASTLILITSLLLIMVAIKKAIPRKLNS